MRPSYFNLSTVASSPWLPINWEQNPPSWAVVAVPSEDSGVTYSVQATYDGLGTENQFGVLVTRAAGVATVTFPFQHGLTTGDTVMIWGTGSTQLDSQPFPAQSGPPWNPQGGQLVPWTVASTPSNTTITYACANAGPTVDQGNYFTKCSMQRVFPVVAALTAATTRQVAQLQYPVTAVRILATVASAGFVSMEVLQGSGR